MVLVSLPGARAGILPRSVRGQEQVERFFSAIKRRTRVFFKDINAERSRIASLDGMMNMYTITGPETAIEALLTFEGVQGEEVS